MAVQHITSPDPNQSPAIDPHYFEEKYGGWTRPKYHVLVSTYYVTLDMDVFVETVKFCRRLADQKPFKDILVGTSMLYIR